MNAGGETSTFLCHSCLFVFFMWGRGVVTVFHASAFVILFSEFQNVFDILYGYDNKLNLLVFHFLIF